MTNRYSRYSIPAGILFIFLVSCSTEQKALSRRASIITVNSQLKAGKQELAKLDEERRRKTAQHEMLDTASKSILQFIHNTRNEIEHTLSRDSMWIGTTEVAREDWNDLKKALTQSQKSLKSVTNKLAFISDLLQRNRVVKLDQDVIFKPGEYEVSPDIAASISNIIRPASEGVDSFIRKYPDFNLSLVITARGYADGTVIAEGSDLYNKLKERLKLQTGNPGSKELNHELSRLRAKKVIELFEAYTTVRAGRKKSNRHIITIYEGKGETFPNPSITNYRTDDPRRRVVLLFWSIFPE